MRRYWATLFLFCSLFFLSCSASNEELFRVSYSDHSISHPNRSGGSLELEISLEKDTLMYQHGIENEGIRKIFSGRNNNKKYIHIERINNEGDERSYLVNENRIVSSISNNGKDDAIWYFEYNTRNQLSLAILDDITVELKWNHGSLTDVFYKKSKEAIDLYWKVIKKNEIHLKITPSANEENNLHFDMMAFIVSNTLLQYQKKRYQIFYTNWDFLELLDCMGSRSTSLPSMIEATITDSVYSPRTNETTYNSTLEKYYYSYVVDGDRLKRVEVSIDSYDNNVFELNPKPNEHAEGSYSIDYPSDYYYGLSSIKNYYHNLKYKQ